MTTSTQTRPSRTDRFAVYLNERTGVAAAVKEFGRKIFPDHWSFMLGEVALYAFVVILLSGTWLTFFFNPSMAEVHYHGSYIPMKGLEMSAAMSSTLEISFDVRGGLLVRQIHHWAALTFVAAIGLHMLRIFFTGAFRKPRELNWVIGFVLFILAMAEGFTGYSLPDDLLSGNGLAIINGLIKAIPFIGTWMSFLFFGGLFPGDHIVPRLYTLHILILPAILVAFLALHLVFVVVHKHTQYAGPGRNEGNVVGNPILPFFAAKAGGFFFVVAGVIVLIASFFTINPIWNYGPYDPSPVSAGTQPDWYIGFADGALRLVPPHLELVIFNHTLSLNQLLPIIIMGGFIVVIMLWPFIENWITGDKREHHIAERPRNNPTRTALGAAFMTFYASMWAAASSDLIATHFQLGMEGVIHFLQFCLIAGPFIAFSITKRICLGLQKKDREIVLHGFESGRIVREPNGEFREVHGKLDDFELYRLTSYDDERPMIVRPDANGRVKGKFRAKVNRWFYQDRIQPVRRGELEAASHDHH